MKGNIQKRGDSHRISVELPRGADGKRRRYYETVPGTRRRDAERRLAELITDINNQRFVEPSTMLLSEYLRQWLRDYGSANVRPKTLVGYTEVIERHLIPKLGRVKLGELRPMHLERFKGDQLRNGRLDGSGGLSERSVSHYLTILSQALNQAVKWGLVSKNVADGVSSPRVEEKEMRALAPEEIGQLMELAKDTRYFLPIHMALHTGMRRSELLGFQWRDLNMDRRELTVNRVLHVLPGSEIVYQPPKTRSSRRVIALPNATVLHLRAHRDFMQSEAARMNRELNSDEQVLAWPDGRILRPSALTHAFTKMVRRAGLHGFRFHDLRHTHASLLLRSRVPVKIVSERLGHSSVATTMDIYAHVLPGDDAEAAEVFAAIADTDVAKMLPST